MATELEGADYVVVDLGKKKRKDVKRLRKGSGKLAAMVDDSLAELRTAGAIGESAQTVVVIVREKTRSRLFL